MSVKVFCVSLLPINTPIQTDISLGKILSSQKIVPIRAMGFLHGLTFKSARRKLSSKLGENLQYSRLEN